MPDFRVSFTRVKLEYYEVDVEDGVDAYHTEARALIDLRRESGRYKLAVEDEAWITTNVRKL